MARPKRPSDDELRRLYVDEQVPARQLADHFQVHRDTVRRWLTTASVPISIANSRGTGPRPHTRAPMLDKELLERMYVRQGRSMTEIGTTLKVGRLRVRRSLEHHEIPIRVNHRRAAGFLQPEVLLKMVAKGLPLSQIARHFHVGEKHLTEVLDGLKAERPQRVANGQGPPRRAVERFEEVVVAENAIGKPITRLVAWLECGHKSPVKRDRLPHDPMTTTFGCKVCAQKES